MTDPTVYAGDERRARPRGVAKPVPRAVLVIALAALYLLVMVPVGFILIYAHRADGRAERSGRTVCEQAETLASLAASFDRTLDLLGGPTKAVAEGELRAPIERAQAEARATERVCRIASGP